MAQKIALRKRTLQELSPDAFICEAYAGLGELYRACYLGYDRGAAIDKEEGRVEALAKDRKNWMAIAGDNARLLQDGLLSQTEVHLWDLDAYGSPLACVDGILQEGRKFPQESFIVATDGTGYRLRLNLSDFKRLQGYVERYGADFVRNNYKQVLTEIIEEQAERAGLVPALVKFYVCGAARQMAHWAIRLRKSEHGTVAA